MSYGYRNEIYSTLHDFHDMELLATESIFQWANGIQYYYYNLSPTISLVDMMAQRLARQVEDWEVPGSSPARD